MDQQSTEEEVAFSLPNLHFEEQQTPDSTFMAQATPTMSTAKAAKRNPSLYWRHSVLDSPRGMFWKLSEQ